MVHNGDGTQMYLVRWEAGHEHCTCPDFQHRQGKVQQPCKHILAAEIVAGAAQSPEYDKNDLNDKRACPERSEGETIARLGGRHSLALLNGELDEADRLDKEPGALAGAA